MLLPGPVELACAKGEAGALCDRNEALFDLARKYGPTAAFTPAGLLILCRGSAATPRASAESSCDRRISTPTTIHVAAGHMHLLGSSIRLELNPGTARVEGAARHPALGLPLAERVHPRPPGRGRRRATSCASPAATTSASASRRGRGLRGRLVTSCGARARPTRCASGSCRSRAGSSAAHPPRLADVPGPGRSGPRRLRGEPRAGARRAWTRDRASRGEHAPRRGCPPRQALSRRSQAGTPIRSGRCVRALPRACRSRSGSGHTGASRRHCPRPGRREHRLEARCTPSHESRRRSRIDGDRGLALAPRPPRVRAPGGARQDAR